MPKYFRRLYSAWLTFMRDDPENPIKDKGVIEPLDRCMMIGQSLKSTAALITSSHVIAAFHPIVVEKALNDEQALFMGQKCYCSSDELAEELKGLPAIPQMYAQFRAGQLPDVIERRLNWAKANLQLAGEVPKILGELYKLLPSRQADKFAFADLTGRLPVAIRSVHAFPYGCIGIGHHFIAPMK